MGVARGSDLHLRGYAKSARGDWKAGAPYHEALLELRRAGVARPGRAMRAMRTMREIIQAIERVGRQYVNAEQVLTDMEIFFVRPRPIRDAVGGRLKLSLRCAVGSAVSCASAPTPRLARRDL